MMETDRLDGAMTASIVVLRLSRASERFKRCATASPLPRDCLPPAQNSPDAMRSEYFRFLPDPMASKSSLLDLIASDPAPAIRLSACETLTALLEGAKAFLAVGQDRWARLLTTGLRLTSCRDVTTSFTTLSAKLAFAVIEIHRVLGDGLSRRAMPSDLVQAELLASSSVLECESILTGRAGHGLPRAEHYLLSISTPNRYFRTRSSACSSARSRPVNRPTHACIAR